MKRLLLVFVAVLAMLVPSYAQNTTPAGVTPVQLANPQYYVTPISATAAVNTQTTLTIPAPAAGLYNYICSLSYQVNNDNTGTAVSNVVSTSTNFNSFAVKFSAIATASIDSGILNAFTLNPGGGCAKSTASATATTFVSPAGLTHSAWTWYAMFYQAP